MINHVHTLLANVSPSSEEARLLYFTVDPTFVPVIYPDNLESYRLSLVGERPGTGESIRSLVSVIYRLDLQKYTSLFDTRITPERADVIADISGLYGSNVNYSVIQSVTADNYLFGRTRDESVDAVLSDLYNTKKNDVDGHNGLSAVLLALVVRMDMYYRAGTVSSR